ncbi:MAG: HAD-IIIA family hydrolase [Clostridia bacterium]|nr:HAD-IIIA family hydrolase [Clostridia bacterium]
MIKCVLFDRDGTLGELVDPRYPRSLVPYCDIQSAFAKIKAKGYTVGVITNQSSIARGTGADYDFDGEFTSWGADIWKICPHDAADNCACRKPKSGLLLAAAKGLGVLPSECLVVGDRLSDILCAVNAGARAALVLTGFGATEKAAVLERFPDTPVLARFDEILRIL